MSSLRTTDEDFGPINALSNLMDQIDTPSQVNGLSMHSTHNLLLSKLIDLTTNRRNNKLKFCPSPTVS